MAKKKEKSKVNMVDISPKRAKILLTLMNMVFQGKVAAPADTWGDLQQMAKQFQNIINKEKEAGNG